MRFSALALVLSLFCLSVSAQVPVLAGKSWEALTPQQRTVLAPLTGQWSQMDASARDTWVALAKRYPEMEANEQQRLRDRMRDWAALSPTERRRVHQGFLAAQRVGPEERQQKWEQYQALAPEQRQALQDRAASKLAVAASTEPAASAAAVDGRPTPPQSPRTAPRDRLDPRTLLVRAPAP